MEKEYDINGKEIKIGDIVIVKDYSYAHFPWEDDIIKNIAGWSGEVVGFGCVEVFFGFGGWDPKHKTTKIELFNGSDLEVVGSVL